MTRKRQSRWSALLVNKSCVVGLCSLTPASSQLTDNFYAEANVHEEKVISFSTLSLIPTPNILPLIFPVPDEGSI